MHAHSGIGDAVGLAAPQPQAHLLAHGANAGEFVIVGEHALAPLGHAPLHRLRGQQFAVGGQAQFARLLAGSGAKQLGGADGDVRRFNGQA